MCGPDSQLNANSSKSQKAAQELARLAEEALGYCAGHFDPIALRLFIHAYWPRVSQLAHMIHDPQGGDDDA